MHQGTAQGKTLMEVFDKFPSHFIFPHPLGIGLLETGEELIDYIGAHLKKPSSLQFACHINYKQTSPFPKYTNSLSVLVPTRTRLQNNTPSSNLVSVLFLPFWHLNSNQFSVCFRAKNNSAGAGLLPPHTDWSQHLAWPPGAQVTPLCSYFPSLLSRFVSICKVFYAYLLINVIKSY